MIIGIEAERANIDQPTGVEHYAQQMILSLAKRQDGDSYVLYLRSKPREWIRDLPKNFSVKVIPFPVFWTQLRISWEMFWHPPDALFIMASALPLIHPKNSTVTIHDIAWKHYPETFSKGTYWYLKFSTWFAIHFAKSIIAVSRQTTDDLVKEYGVAPEKIAVVHHGFDRTTEIAVASDDAERKKLETLPRKFILYLGTLQPRKNIIGLIDAFRLLKKDSKFSEYSLVIAGGKGWLYDEIMRRIAGQDDIIYFGYVQDRFTLIRKAALLVQPAFYEGFGMQLLDAFSEHVPVACSNRSSLPEVAGDAAQLFNPDKPEEIAAAISAVLGNESRAAELVAKGKERLKQFTWSRAAEETHAVIQKKMEPTPRQHFRQPFFLFVSTLLQGFLALAVATAMIPQQWAWAQVILAALGAIFFDEYYATLSVILAIPFYLALPNPRFDTLSAWRLAVGFVFIAWLIRTKIWKKGHLAAAAKRLPLWDLWIAAYAAAALISISIEPFKSVGAKKLLFFANAYLLYILAGAVFNSRQRITGAIKAFFASCMTVVLIGYAQFIATLFASTYHFWQYWATVISFSYYGSALSDSLTYSNSWFSFTAGQPPSLRMFSILPDSHAFALVCVLALAPALALLAMATTRKQKIWLWISIILIDAAIALSGTRGAWAGVLLPFAVILVLNWKSAWKNLTAWRGTIAIVALGAVVVISPFLQKAFADLDHGYNSGNFLIRAESIYDLQESSNAGRILIWKHTLAYDVHHPIFGSGLGNFVVTLVPGTSDYNALANTNQKEFNLPARYITAHDLYLDVLTETGLLGLVPFLFYLAYITQALWKSARRDDVHPYIVAELLAFAWIVGYSFFDGTLINDRVLLYFLIGLAIAGRMLTTVHENQTDV